MNPLMLSLALTVMLAPLAAHVRRTDRIQGNALSDSSRSAAASRERRAAQAKRSSKTPFMQSTQAQSDWYYYDGHASPWLAPEW